MKPSERIKEIASLFYEKEKKECFAHGFEICKCDYTRCRSRATLEYLDEEWEKDCNKSGHEFEQEQLSGLEVCKKCKVMSAS